MLFGSLFLNPQKKENVKDGVLPTIVADSANSSTISLKPEEDDMFSFPPFPSPNPQAYSVSPFESLGFPRPSTTPSISSASSASSSIISSPATSPSQSPAPTLRRGVPPRTRLRKPSVTLKDDSYVSEHFKPTPRSSSISLATGISEHPQKKERRGSKGTASEEAYEEACRIAGGAWSKSVRFEQEPTTIEPHAHQKNIRHIRQLQFPYTLQYGVK